MNIYWEFLHLTKRDTYFRLAAAVLFVAIVIACGAFLIKRLDNLAYKYYNEYSILNCP